MKSPRLCRGGLFAMPRRVSDFPHFAGRQRSSAPPPLPNNPAPSLKKIGSVTRWLFHLHSTVKIRPFYPLAESTAKAFCWLFLWSFKEKSINHFLWHSQKIQERTRKQLWGPAIVSGWSLFCETQKDIRSNVSVIRIDDRKTEEKRHLLTMPQKWKALL